MYHVELSFTNLEGSKEYHQYTTNSSKVAIVLAERLKKHFTCLVELDIIVSFEIVITSDFDIAEMERVNAK